MYNNDYMYAIERNDEYLAHYGIRGMKWGVRKAIARGDSARLGRQYAKAQKKLAKLEKRASKADKYKKRAIRYGVGAAAAGGLAALGTSGVGKIYRSAGKGVASAAGVGGNIMNKAGDALRAYGRTPGKGSKLKRIATRAGMNLNSAGKAVSGASTPINAAAVKGSNAIVRWGKGNSIGQGIQNTAGKYAGKLGAGKGAAFNTVSRDAARNATKGIAGLSNNTIARIGAGAIGAGLAAASAKNAYRAATAQKKAAQFKSEMNKAFAGTQYAKSGNQTKQTGNRQGGKKRRRR